jgi:hypothetical protein
MSATELDSSSLGLRLAHVLYGSCHPVIDLIWSHDGSNSCYDRVGPSTNVAIDVKLRQIFNNAEGLREAVNR